MTALLPLHRRPGHRRLGARPGRLSGMDGGGGLLRSKVGADPGCWRTPGLAAAFAGDVRDCGAAATALPVALPGSWRPARRSTSPPQPASPPTCLRRPLLGLGAPERWTRSRLRYAYGCRRGLARRRRYDRDGRRAGAVRWAFCSSPRWCCSRCRCCRREPAAVGTAALARLRETARHARAHLLWRFLLHRVYNDGRQS
jgi:hypothetical protein